MASKTVVRPILSNIKSYENDKKAWFKSKYPNLGLGAFLDMCENVKIEALDLIKIFRTINPKTSCTSLYNQFKQAYSEISNELLKLSLN